MNIWIWAGYILIVLSLLANFGTYVLFPLGGAIWTGVAVLGSYFAFRHHGRK